MMNKLFKILMLTLLCWGSYSFAHVNSTSEALKVAPFDGAQEIVLKDGRVAFLYEITEKHFIDDDGYNDEDVIILGDHEWAFFIRWYMGCPSLGQQVAILPISSWGEGFTPSIVELITWKGGVEYHLKAYRSGGEECRCYDIH